MGFFGDKKARTVALIDISSGSVAGAFVRLEKGKKPRFLTNLRIPMEERAEGEVGIIRALDSLIHALMEAAPLVRKAVGHGGAEEAYVTIGAPWLSVSVDVKRMDGKEIVVTSDLMKSMIEHHEKGVSSEATLLSAVLNGYEVKDPIGKRVREAEFSVLTSKMETEMHDRLTGSLRRIAPKVTLIPHAMVMHHLLKTLMKNQQDYIALLVSEERAEIIVLKRGTLQNASTLNAGTNEFARAARGSGFHGTNEGSALIDTKRNEMLTKAIDAAEEVWLSSLVESLKSLAKSSALPQNVFLIADAFSRDFLKRLLAEDAVKSLWISGERANVVPIQPQELTPYVAIEEAAQADLILEGLAVSVPPL